MVGGKSKDMAGKQIMAGWTPPKFHVKVVRENEDFASSGTRWNLVGPCKWCGTWPRWCGYYPILSTPKSVLGDQQGPVQLIESLLDRSDSNVVMNLSLLNLWLLCLAFSCKPLVVFKLPDLNRRTQTHCSIGWLSSTCKFHVDNLDFAPAIYTFPPNGDWTSLTHPCSHLARSATTLPLSPQILKYFELR